MSEQAKSLDANSSVKLDLLQKLEPDRLSYALGRHLSGGPLVTEIEISIDGSIDSFLDDDRLRARFDEIAKMGYEIRTEPRILALAHAIIIKKVQGVGKNYLYQNTELDFVSTALCMCIAPAVAVIIPTIKIISPNFLPVLKVVLPLFFSAG